MSVTLNPEALLAIQRGEGALGEAIRHDLERRAEAVVVQATRNIAHIIPATEGFDIVGSTTSIDGEGLRVDVGVTGDGKWSRYFDAKAIREVDSGTPGDWLKPALEAAAD